MIRTARAGLTRFLLCLLPVLGVWLLAPDRAWPQSAADSFKGKEIRILVGYSAGGGYDIYARTVARYLGNHIPGNPTVIVQNMPGADGLKLANYLYVQAPKDGTVIALTNRNVAVAPILGLVDAENVKYDAQKFYWIANLNSEVSVAVFRSDAGVNSVEDLRQKPMIVGSTGLTANNAVYPYVMNNLIGTKLKVVIGYPGTSDVTLALERGEIQGIGGWAWSSIMAQRPYWIRDKTISPLLQLSTQKIPELAGVPSILDYAKTDETRQALELIFSPDILGRPFFAPPGISTETGQVLRAAFDGMSNDPSFRAAADTAKLDLSYMNGETLERLVNRIGLATPTAVELAKKITQRGATAVESKNP
jgi:tripartite-type tricarboxylate transporter receptor subunit TctC